MEYTSFNLCRELISKFKSRLMEAPTLHHIDDKRRKIADFVHVKAQESQC